MKADERQCPRCAETIKKAAHLCKHCGHRFSEAEIQAARAEDASRSKFKSNAALAVVGLLVVLAVISSRGDDDAPSGAADGTSGAANGRSESENPMADASRQYAWIEVSKDAIRAKLRDPDSAQFQDVHFYSGGEAPVACGQVNGKNGFGGYTGFERFVAAGSTIAVLESEMASPNEMTKVWQEMCVKAPSDEA